MRTKGVLLGVIDVSAIRNDIPPFSIKIGLWIYKLNLHSDMIRVYLII